MKKLLFPILRLLRAFKLWRLGLDPRKTDIHEYRVVSGQAWNEFCDNLKAAGGALLYGNAPKDAFNQAEGYRYLARLARTGLNAFVENTDPGFVQLERMIDETAKIGADNPDNYYLNARISPEFEYRIRGKRNSISFLSFHIFNGNYGQKGGIQICDEMASSDLSINEDGTFEIILSKKRKGQNWLKIDDETTLLIARQTFLDKQNEHAAELKLSSINGNVSPAPLTAQKLDKALEVAALLVGGSAIKFSTWANKFTQHSNTLPLMDEKLHKGAGGDKNLVYYHSHYKLNDDECLVIESEIPDCDYWNFQLNNYWMESLDYRYHKIHINKHTAHYNTDGSVTIVVSKSPIEHPNYLTTTGHNEGTMLWRWLLPDRKITPKCQVRSIKNWEMP